KLVYLAHGLIEDGGDDAAVGMTRRALIPARQLELAPGAPMRFIEEEFETHAIGIGRATGKATIHRHDELFGTVSVGARLFGHVESNDSKAIFQKPTSAMAECRTPESLQADVGHRQGAPATHV